MAKWNAISEEKLEEIRVLLADTMHTYSKIAEMTHTNYGAVCRVAKTSFSVDFIRERKRNNYRISRIGENNPSYGLRGSLSRKYLGVIEDGKGYQIICKPDWYTSRKGSKHIYLHHVVVCLHLGLSCIPKGYCVHHCDGRKTNNDFSNLVLLPLSLHSKLHAYLGSVEGVTTISKESTLKWAEAHGFRLHDLKMI